MLFAVTYSVQSLLIVALGVAVAAFVTGWLLRKDTALEAYQRGVLGLSSKLRALPHTPGGLIAKFSGMLEDIAIKDVSGFYQKAKNLGDLADEPDRVMRLLREDVMAQFPSILDKPEIGQFILDQVDQWKAGKEAATKKAMEAAGYVAKPVAKK